MTKQEEILKLKKEKNAVILAHYYAEAPVQEVADYVGDSFYLSKVAARLECDTIIFAGVRFMAECAKMLNPDKTVLLPDERADCFMAHMINNEYIEKMRQQYDDLAVVCYINSTTETKTYADVCVTSSNALNIVKKLPQKNILFIPDKNLGRYVAEKIPEKNFIFNDGFCPIHEHMQIKQIEELKKKHPQAQILVHPECNEAIIKIADYIGSTSGIIDYASYSSSQEFIIATEIGVKHKLEQGNPQKKFYFTARLPKCLNMKLNTLENVLQVLKRDSKGIEVDEKLADMAVKPLEKMMELA